MLEQTVEQKKVWKVKLILKPHFSPKKLKKIDLTNMKWLMVDRPNWNYSKLRNMDTSPMNKTTKHAFTVYNFR